MYSPKGAVSHGGQNTVLARLLFEGERLTVSVINSVFSRSSGRGFVGSVERRARGTGGTTCAETGNDVRGAGSGVGVFGLSKCEMKCNKESEYQSMISYAHGVKKTF